MQPRGAECQCVVCNRVFSSESAWKLHQRPDRGCLDPSSLNMHLRADRDAWKLPSYEAGGMRSVRQARKALLAQPVARSSASVKVGDMVKLHRDRHPSRGTWLRCEGKRGVVMGLNLVDDEVQVRGQGFRDAWFRSEEWQPA